ncbi:MAG: hypothetical protein Q8M19_23275 [Reyranella sp.]|nr:hypothetical protein [Reyranella sp.]
MVALLTLASAIERVLRTIADWTGWLIMPASPRRPRAPEVTGLLD